MAPTFVFLDANARLGDIVSEAVGAEGFVQTQDFPGECMHHELSEHGLVALNTVCHCERDTYTYTEKGGPKSSN